MTEARYDEIAAAYSSRADDYSSGSTRVLLELAGEVAGRRVLDIACGHGLITRELARRGAAVTGLDISSALLDGALSRELARPLGIGYVLGDVTAAGILAADVLADASPFDLVTCHFGLTDIDDLEAALANVTRLLRPGGGFAFVILHPCFPGVERVSGSWPSGSTYFDETWWLADGELSWIRAAVGSNHRMVSTYFNALVDAGLTVDRVLEPAPDEEWVRQRPGAAALPVYLAVRAVRAVRAVPAHSEAGRTR